MTALEAETGVTLLQRRGNRMELTPVGQTLVAHTERILAELRAADAALSADAGEVTGSLRIGIPFGEGPPIMSAALTAVRARHPGLQMRLQGLASDRAPEAVRLGRLDMAIVSRYDAITTPRPGLHEQLLGSDALTLCLPIDHPAAQDPPTELADMADHPWVLGPTTPLGALAVGACHRAGFEPHIAAAVDDLHAALGLVSLGWGATLAPLLTPSPSGRRLLRVPLHDIDELRSTYILSRDGEQQLPTVATVSTAVALFSQAKFGAVPAQS
jgi:DNA-binding transcriptional LysR family regulator